ncbi:hypothetical protein RhiirA5_427920 [Rhizophagus irregularis]|uniref:Uncharacterized protein n=1 Tax=Rhizophagus irregularis TaxID=588596 RepID=A0A2N0P1A8_9GLOM|nr:hypothetical protein RhiirA5_432041 [Rhizophagus irregularis]PKC00608.1 hypothetical protein RhiirA5_427920 [Rhizophagus irregularis]
MIVLGFVVCGIAWHVIENPFFIKFLRTLRPGHTLPSKKYFPACDGWTNSANESIWNFLIHTPDHEEYLWCLKGLPSESHSSHSAHASNLISKDICSTSFANQILTKCNTIVTYFKKSHQGGSSLKDEAKACDISGGGLKKWVDTRCMIVQMRHKIPLENLKSENPGILSTAVLSVLHFLMTERKKLMHQMKKYRKRENLEVGEAETPDEWCWMFLVKSWLIYGKRRTKKELPHYSVEKSAEEIHQIFIDTHLNPDQDLFELNDDLPNNVLYIIESENEEVDEPMNENEDNNIEWDPAAEAVEIVDTM